MDTLSYDHNDFSAAREAEADANLMVKFFIKEREDKEKSAQEGRPIFKDCEYIEIRVPGKRDALACRPATHADKQRFPRHYAAFKERTEMPVEGTPLTEWPQISSSMVEQLSFFRVKTVEHLVAMSDGDASKIQGAAGLKEKAKAFLEASEKTKLIAEKQALEAKVADQEKRLQAMEAAMRANTTLAQAAPAPPAENAPADIESDTPAPEIEATGGDQPAEPEAKPNSRRRRNTK